MPQSSTKKALRRANPLKLLRDAETSSA